jgi:gas vesicle protein
MQNTRYLGLAVLAGAIGAAAALLLAPASGRETRRRLNRRIRDEKHKLLRKGNKAIGGASEYVQQQVAQGRRRLAQVVSR